MLQLYVKEVMNRINKISIVRCPFCGLEYAPLYDRIEHKSYCRRYLLASVKYGIIVEQKERESIKREGWSLVWSNDDIPLQERIEGAELVFTSWFSRSVQANRFKLNHPSYENYAAMLLNQSHVKSILHVEVYDGLVKVYGTRFGLANGRSYWKPLKF